MISRMPARFLVRRPRYVVAHLCAVIVAVCMPCTISQADDWADLVAKVEMQRQKETQILLEYLRSYTPTPAEVAQVDTIRAKLSERTSGLGFCRDLAWTDEYETTNRQVRCSVIVVDTAVVTNLANLLRSQLDRVIPGDFVPWDAPPEGIVFYGTNAEVLVANVFYEQQLFGDTVALYYDGYWGRLGNTDLVATGKQSRVVVRNQAFVDEFRRLWDAVRAIEGPIEPKK
jgi:hypothetical protein